MTIPQAAATLAATLVGAKVGLFSDQVVNAVVFIVLASIVLGSVLTRRFAEPRRAAGPVAAAHGCGGARGASGRAALEAARDGGRVHRRPNSGLVMPVAVSTRDDRAIADAERIADEATKAAEAQGADVEARVRFADSYAAAMLEAVIDRRASALVTPLSTDPGIVGRLFGGELERIGRESPIPVIAVRPGPEKITKVVLGLDSRADTSADRYDQRLAMARLERSRPTSRCRLRWPEQRRADRCAGLADVSERVLGKQAVANHPEVLVPGTTSWYRPRLCGAGSVRERVRPQPRRHSARDSGGSLQVARVAGRRAGVELPGRAGGYDRRGGDAAAGGGRVALRPRRGPVGRASGALVALAHVLGHRHVHLGDVV